MEVLEAVRTVLAVREFQDKPLRPDASTATAISAAPRSNDCLTPNVFLMDLCRASYCSAWSTAISSPQRRD